MSEYISFGDPSEHDGLVAVNIDEELLMVSRQREEIVRCCDCRNGHQTPARGFRCWHWIELDGNGDPVPADVSPDGYCYLGKRRPE